MDSAPVEWLSAGLSISEYGEVMMEARGEDGANEICPELCETVGPSGALGSGIVGGELGGDRESIEARLALLVIV